MTLYMLGFKKPLGNSRHRAHFYLGHYSGSQPVCFARRMREHASENGAKIVAAAMQRHIPVYVLAIWPGSLLDERRYKNWKNHKDVLRAVVQRPRTAVFGWNLPIRDAIEYADRLDQFYLNDPGEIARFLCDLNIKLQNLKGGADYVSGMAG